MRCAFRCLTVMMIAAWILIYMRLPHRNGSEIMISTPDKLFIAAYTKAKWIDDIKLGFRVIAKPFQTLNYGEYHFFGDKDINFSDDGFNYHVVEANENDLSRDCLCSVLYQSMRYFIENTTYNWYLRTGPDTFLSMEGFPHLMEDLSSRGDPVEDMIFAGNVVTFRNWTYFQGGSGYLFSRRFAKHLLENFDQVYSPNKTVWDDIDLGNYIKKKFSLAEANSYHMFGHQANINLSRKLDLRNLTYCPGSPPAYRGVKTRLSKFKDIFAIHIFHGMALRDYRIIQENIISAPESLYWYQNGFSPVFCIKKN